VVALQRDTCCPSKRKRTRLRCPSALMGRAAPLLAAAVTKPPQNAACRRRTERQSLPFSLPLGETFPILQGLRSAAEPNSPGRGVQLSLVLHQPCQGAPPPAWNTPRYPTGRHGDGLCCWEPLVCSRRAALCPAGLQLCSSSPIHPASASLPRVPNLIAAGEKVLPCGYRRTQPVRTSWKYPLRSQPLLSTTESRIVGLHIHPSL